MELMWEMDLFLKGTAMREIYKNYHWHPAEEIKLNLLERSLKGGSYESANSLMSS